MYEMTRRAFVATAAILASTAKPNLGFAQAPAQETQPPAAAPAPAAPTPEPTPPTPPAGTAGQFKQPPLPFQEGDLMPFIGPRTVALHYRRHHASYYNNLNIITKDTKYAAMNLEQVVVEGNKDTDKRFFNNAGQALNHELYWEMLKPGGAKAPSGRLAQLIYDNFGSLADLKTKMVTSASNVFGSGWTWLEQSGSKLSIVNTLGGDSPLTSGKNGLLGVDVWEHAYYLDYENRRPEHVKALLDNLVNWDVVASRLKA